MDKTSNAPALVASSSINVSTLAALVSFVMVTSSTIALKAAAKPSVDECVFHTFALVP